MNGWEIILGLVLSIVIGECTEISPWLARKLVRWAATRWSADAVSAAGYAEEWVALIEMRPGKLLKLFTAAGLAMGAAGRAVPRRTRLWLQRPSWFIRLLRFATRRRGIVGEWGVGRTNLPRHLVHYWDKGEGRWNPDIRLEPLRGDVQISYRDVDGRVRHLHFYHGRSDRRNH